MEKFFETLSKCPLFDGIEQSDLNSMIACLDGKTIDISKGNPVFLEGTSARFVGVVLAGTVQVIREDYYGNRSVMTSLQPGELFGEAFSLAGLNAMPVSVIAVKDSTVLLLDCRHILTTCSNSCHFHTLLLRNLLQEMAQKNLTLSQKIRYMSQKTTREKIMAFLLDQAKQQKSHEFVIPYDRQALADYLGVERSAMSAEISKLKKSGEIDTKGAWFCLKAPENTSFS
ncbi:MAG: Crp/Fnr family transcriptional regulator [Lachnospiraceae bacterium]|nr:Crp/Fnr family transcriptional regulator [Lachnospiraceae bacterium]